MAATPEALALNKEAGELCDQLSARLMSNDSTSSEPMTREQLIDVDKQIDRMFEEMKKLPKLTPQEAQKEFDAFTDEKLYKSIGFSGG
jgi:hypothetical protein